MYWFCLRINKIPLDSELKTQPIVVTSEQNKLLWTSEATESLFIWQKTDIFLTFSALKIYITCDIGYIIEKVVYARYTNQLEKTWWAI